MRKEEYISTLKNKIYSWEYNPIFAELLIDIIDEIKELRKIFEATKSKEERGER